MKILEIGTLRVRGGGPPFSISRQMRGLRDNGVDSVCFMQPCHYDEIIEKDLKFQFSQRPLFNIKGFEYIPKIAESLSQIADFDIMHIQGTWSYFYHASAQYARNHNIPYVISPRGSLYAQALSQKFIKKKLAWLFYHRNDFFKASCIHATSIEEMMEIRNIGCKNPIAVIPNAYDTLPFVNDVKSEDGIFRIGFLGRIDPRKHVESLLYALEEIKKKKDNVELVVIGGGDLKYEKFLEAEAVRLNLKSSVSFEGFLTGIKKDNAIRKCDVFVFPSDFENWGNVVPDVLAREVPAVTTKGMPWGVLEERKCGWRIDNNQQSINHILFDICNMSKNQLREMGRRGHELINKEYSVEKVGKQLKSLYEWILGNEEKPEYVYL